MSQEQSIPKLYLLNAMGRVGTGIQSVSHLIHGEGEIIESSLENILSEMINYYLRQGVMLISESIEIRDITKANAIEQFLKHNIDNLEESKKQEQKDSSTK